MVQYFAYGDREAGYLRERDPILGTAMDEIGHIYRPVTPDLFTALVGQIISQQISTKGAATVWSRLLKVVEAITPERIAATDAAVIQGCGTSMRKARYIRELAERVLDGSVELEALRDLPDGEVCKRLGEIRGIGVWTAEMLMTFSMQRPDIMSWGDIAIHRGLRMLYRHRNITPRLFEKYRRRYSPCATVACLYLWAIAGGACPELYDPAPVSGTQRKAGSVKKRLAAKGEHI